MATGADTYLESDGASVTVDLSYTVVNNQVAVVEGWIGIAVVPTSPADQGHSGGKVALTIDGREYQFTVPSTLAVAKGQIVYVDITDLTGHTPDDTAYSTSAGANKVAFFKATTTKDSNNVVHGKMLGPGQLAS